jgi:uncharacterized protein (DUF885 family)
LAAAGQRAIKDNVNPAFRRLREVYDKRYLPAAREKIATSSLPPGMPYYEAVLALFTTTRMSPKEIHDLGLAEVARIGKEMDATVAATGFKGTRADFQKSINIDPRFSYTNREDMLAGYRDIAKRADAELPRFFAELPRLPYGIRAMQPEEGDNAGHYVRGSADGSRAGHFEVNVNSLSRRPNGPRRGCERCDQRAVHYWITSSARSSSDGGIVSPSAFAVFRLITSSSC